MDALVIVCSGNTNEIMVWAWMLWSSYALGTRTRFCFGHGCSGHRRLWEHERDYALGMDALVIVSSGDTNEILLWAWMLWSSQALGTRTRLWFAYGCSFRRMLWEHSDIGNAALAAPKNSWNSLKREEKPAHSGIFCEDSLGAVSPKTPKTNHASILNINWVSVSVIRAHQNLQLPRKTNHANNHWISFTNKILFWLQEKIEFRLTGIRFRGSPKILKPVKVFVCQNEMRKTFGKKKMKACAP